MAEENKQALTGGCACRSIRYRSEAKPGFSFHCQCRQCQRATGSGHASAFVLPADAVSISGDIRYFDQLSDSGNTVSRGFCPACGSPVMNRNSGYPGSVYIHAATLDDPAKFRPTAVVFSASAMPWDFVDPALSE